MLRKSPQILLLALSATGRAMSIRSDRHFNLNRTQWCVLIDEWIFNETDRALVKRRLLDGVCFQELADEFCLSIDTCKRRFYKAEKLLFKHL